MYNPMRDVKDFHDTFAPEQYKQGLPEKVDRRHWLIEEEYLEVRDALSYLERTYLGMTSSTIEEAREELTKELVDLLYMLYGTGDEFGLDLERAWHQVHTSNMAKVWGDGKVHRNEYGKVLKPPGHAKPDLSFVNEHRV